MSKYWSKLAKKVEPYVPGEQPQDKKYIKLNTNENPYPPSPKVMKAIKQATNEDLKLYPDPTCEELKATLADYYGLKKSQVFVGNGSDEVLALLFMAFFDADDSILLPEITYSFYPVYANLFNINYNLVQLDKDFSLSLDGFSEPNEGIILPNPNAPTGKYLSLEFIEEILKKNIDEVVIIDEAYIDFGGESAVKLIDKYPNLLVVQTLSKSRALAGLRVGFVFGQEDLMEGLDRIKNSFNSYTLDRLALVGAKEAIKDEEYFQETRSKIIKTRERVSEELRKIGFKVIESKANFIFVSHLRVQAENLFNQLKEKGILVRYFNQPRIENFLRVSIGTDEEMDLLIKTLKEIIE
ncbi:histidinol-phosphate aminotransferase [Orenia metallireducens]|jgi:histidinol-phosphate aminotransferase|uniref:Histidinol-phosphate aminotransferase n=1 Tax=Orenia metallireducens TaxID=1413210 RepID=A0A285G634_9FIRM|nr:histidinol-phosphate transaminase [Orenia metallireducens]PRX28310.1 histidinol-phosphate aminotransferase [Orenia metallireducens]SNY19017.1 histidinol-phosphate aminotransferase [Orenia metallireducens]